MLACQSVATPRYVAGIHTFACCREEGVNFYRKPYVGLLCVALFGSVTGKICLLSSGAQKSEAARFFFIADSRRIGHSILVTNSQKLDFNFLRVSTSLRSLTIL